MSKNCTPLWREAHFEVNVYKTPHVCATIGSWDVEKVHAVVARSTFRSQNVQNTPFSDHFWILRCRKSAAVARSTFPSQNVQNTTCLRHYWKLRCRKSARRCGAKHISKSTCTKHTILGPLLEVQLSLRFTTLHYITLHYSPIHYAPLNYTTLHNTTTTTTQLHSTTLHYTNLRGETRKVGKQERNRRKNEGERAGKKT